jgi:serine/threonine-protein phosphatase 2A activator
VLSQRRAGFTRLLRAINSTDNNTPVKIKNKMQASISESIKKNGFQKPVKKINEASDLEFFKETVAYDRITDLVSRLSLLISTKEIPESSSNRAVSKVVGILQELNTWISEIPPSTGPRRFGNVSFRTWQERLEERVPSILKEQLGTDGNHNAFIELVPYFLGSFGSKQRMDFGTGHELSFLAFVGGLLYTEIIVDPSGEDVLLLFYNYFHVVQNLVLTYTLEPAGSHGVWGLDDHFHLPYIFGSAQIVDITQSDRETPELPPKAVMDKSLVKDLAPKNLYFDAIGFIYRVKKGNFFEHSPILFDVTGVATWHKIHRGMIKMYVAEVLGKFPVVQHFLFGGALFPWQKKD